MHGLPIVRDDTLFHVDDVQSNDALTMHSLEFIVSCLPVLGKDLGKEHVIVVAFLTCVDKEIGMRFACGVLVSFHHTTPTCWSHLAGQTGNLILVPRGFEEHEVLGIETDGPEKLVVVENVLRQHDYGGVAVVATSVKQSGACFVYTGKQIIQNDENRCLVGIVLSIFG